MAITLYKSGTEYVANELTFTRGTVGNITSVGVYHTTNPSYIPIVSDFTPVTLVPGSGALAEGTKIDVLSLIGPRGGQVNLSVAGDYQRWVLIVTATEDIIRRPDVITVL